MLRAVRSYQTHAHPRLFWQIIQLTDGSTTRIASVTNSRPFVKVGVDALSHPSWNPRLRSQMLLNEHGEVAKFRERFEVNEKSFEEFEGLVGEVKKESKAKIPAKKASKKK